MTVTDRTDALAHHSVQLALATWTSLLNFWAWGLIGPVALRYAESMSLSKSQVGLLIATPILSGALLRLVSGTLTDRFGGRIMFPAICFASIGPVLAVGVEVEKGSYPLLLGAAFLLGVPGAVFSIGIPFVSGWYQPSHRGFATGVFGMGMGGVALSAYVTPRLVNLVGPLETHLIIAAALAATGGLCIAALHNGPYFVRNVDPVLPHLKGAVRLRLTWAFSFLYAVVFGGVVAFGAYLPTYVHNVYGFSTIASGSRTAGFGLAAVLARPIGGMLADRITTKYLVMASLGGAAVLAAVGALKPPADLWAGMTFLALAISLGIGCGAIFEWVAFRIPERSLGAVTGIVSAAGGLGGYFPPIVMNLTYDSVHHSYTFGLVLLAVTALGALVYTGVWMAAHRPSADPEEVPEAPAAHG